MEGLAKRYTTDPMDILQAHTNTWGKQWKAGVVVEFEAAAAAVRHLRKQITNTNNGTTKKIFSPEQIRRAAKKFKRKTSTGVDHWTFTEILLMPDPVLLSLGTLLSNIQHSGRPPLQNMTTIMATLPKKCGGTRTVAIAATLYRLPMELDNEEVAAYEKESAFHGDSATAGASAVRAAEDRALLAELASCEGKQTVTLLWDLKKFLDSINIPKLVEEADVTGFPIRQLALSLAVHLAPRRLQLGKAMGMLILEFGQSILAGCKRSTHPARVYTVRAVRKLDDDHPHITIGSTSTIYPTLQWPIPRPSW